MTTFQLDKTGSVELPGWDHNERPIPLLFFWHTLKPFTQGYVEALFASFRETMTRADERKRPACALSDWQIWLLKHGRGGVSRTTLSKATNVMCAGLIRRGWLEKDDNGIVRITEAGEKALRTAMPTGFSDLAPETLARIIEDCKAQSAVYTDRKPDQTDGRIFWSGRQNNVLRHRGFPPLTVQLGDDGKVKAA